MNSHPLNLQSQRSAVLKLMALISKVLVDDGNKIINPQGIFKFWGKSQSSKTQTNWWKSGGKTQTMSAGFHVNSDVCYLQITRFPWVPGTHL